MATKSRGIMKTTLEKMLRDLKAVYTDTWFLPKDNFASAVDVWYKALGGFNYDQLKAAFDTYIANNDKPPAPSRIRELIFEERTAEERQPQFNEADYWETNNYWVLLDLDGYHLNETVAPTEVSSDTIREWLVKSGYDLTGTILKPVDFKTYKPKYRRVP